MEISIQNCVVVQRDHVAATTDDLGRLELLIHSEYDTGGNYIHSHETIVVLSEEAAIELALDILIHYNVYMSA